MPDLYAPGSLSCANCGKPANATVLVGKANERAVCDDCMAKAADWKPPLRGMTPQELEQVGEDVRAGRIVQIQGDLVVTPVKRGRPLTLRGLKFPDYAARGERCPWCQNLKRGRCSGCGQVYGSDDTKGSTARRVTRKAGDFLLSAPVPPVEVPASSQVNAVSEASAPTPPQPVVLVLPEPPSANVWWRRTGTRMHLSHEARAYKRDVFQRAGVKDAPIFPTGDVTLVMVWRRTLKAGDLDKRLGVLLDALQSIAKYVPDPTAKDPKKKRRVILAPGVYDRDAQVAMIWARRCDVHEQLEPGTVRVEVSAIA